MLLKEIIIANAALSTLTEDQIKAIETLSANDENSVIAKKTSEIYNEMDSKIKTITGIDRTGDEKSYNYFERAVKTIKDSSKSSEGLQKQIDDLTAEKTRLEGVIASGYGDADIKAQLESAKKDLTNVQSQFNKVKKDNEELVKTHAGEILGMKLDSELSRSMTGIEFNKNLPKQTIDMIVESTFGKIKGMNPAYVKDEAGNSVLTFNDAAGVVIRNSENALNPITASELIKRELNAAGILAAVQNPAGGAGTGGGNPGGGAGAGTFDLSSAKTQVEANSIIENALLAKGLTRGSSEFASESTQAWKDNNVSQLPTV